MPGFCPILFCHCRVLNDYFTKVSIEETDKKEVRKETGEKVASAWNADEVGSSL